jgi:hypothetical protein
VIPSWYAISGIHQQGRWVWTSSGRPFTFVEWGDGEPQAVGNHQACVYLDTAIKKLVDDDNCDGSATFFICEQRCD